MYQKRERSKSKYWKCPLHELKQKTRRQKLFPAKNNPKFCQKHFWHDCQSEKQIFDQKIAEPNFLILLEKKVKDLLEVGMKVKLVS